MDTVKKKLTVVVPVYNEEDNVEHFAQAIHEALDNLDYDYTLLFIDDGSQDSSRVKIRAMEETDSHIGHLFLSKNYGHQAALTCGLNNAEGDVVITMDGDMQHPPALLPELLKKWEEGYEVVQTIREATEGVGFFKRFTSATYYKLVNLIATIPIQPGGSDFRLMDRKAVLAYREYQEQSPFIRGIIGSMGYKQVQFPFVAPERFAGKSKFSLKKMMKFAMDGILNNSVLPLRISFYVGLLSMVFSIGLFAHVMYETWVGDTVAGWSTIMLCLSFFGGVQLLVLGVLGEYVGRIFLEVKNRPRYLIQDRCRV